MPRFIKPETLSTPASKIIKQKGKPMDEIRERKEREFKLIELYAGIIRAKGLTLNKSVLAAQNIYNTWFVDDLPNGKRWYHVEAAEKFAPCLELLPWQFIKTRYLNSPAQEREDGETVPCPRCKKPLKKVEIMYPGTDSEKPFTLPAWQCQYCSLVVHDDDLSQTDFESVSYV